MAKKLTTQKKSAEKPASPKSTLRRHLDRIHQVEASQAAAGADRGACLVTDPQTGQNRCIRTTAETCKALKGAFIGGPCGG